MVTENGQEELVDQWRNERSKELRNVLLIIWGFTFVCGITALMFLLSAS